jgi:hypothetical protein
MIAWRELNRTFLDDLKSINPPAEAEPAHEKLVVATEAIDAWFGEMIAALTVDCWSMTRSCSVPRTAMPNSGSSTRTELERVATDNGIAVNLDCPTRWMSEHASRNASPGTAASSLTGRCQH